MRVRDHTSPKWRGFWKPFKKNNTMKTSDSKKPGPRDRDYVNKSQEHEVKYEPKRKTPAKKFGEGGDNGGVSGGGKSKNDD